MMSNEGLEKALRDGELDVAAGTAWLWARAGMAGSVDTLFVDEAGQLSLAGVLAVAGAARNLVLLAVTIASEAIVRMLGAGECGNWSGTLMDLAVRTVEAPNPTEIRSANPPNPNEIRRTKSE